MHIRKTPGAILLGIYLLAVGLFSAPAHAQLTMPSGSNAGVESSVDVYFSDTPQMIAVAKCESGFRQFGQNGLPLRGGNGATIGVFQIDENVHAALAQALGFDIYSTVGNIGYAKYLYQKQGLSPWFGCTGDVSNQTAATSSSKSLLVTSSPLTINLSMGATNSQVITLQQLLNAAGFSLAAAGPGSAGNETNRFGALTRQALERFQCSAAIVCGGNESTTGYGVAGPRTRAALLKTIK